MSFWKGSGWKRNHFSRYCFVVWDRVRSSGFWGQVHWKGAKKIGKIERAGVVVVVIPALFFIGLFL